MEAKAYRAGCVGQGCGRSPNFMIIGASRSATSTLYNYLTRHPQVFITTSKEPQFFSRDSVYSRGTAWYSALFAGAKEDQLCREASTTYTRWPLTPDVPARIARISSETKFIYIMRHPVDRAFSHYKHHMRTDVTITFEEAMNCKDAIYEGWNGEGYVYCSLYIRQIEQYLRYFPREAFLFLLFDNFIQDPTKTLEQCQHFLGIPQMDLIAANPVIAGASGPEHFIRKRTTQRLRRIPGIGKAADALPKAWRDRLFRVLKHSPVGKALMKRFQVPPMQEETRLRLLKLFEEPNCELAAFLGRDLSGWSKRVQSYARGDQGQLINKVVS